MKRISVLLTSLMFVVLLMIGQAFADKCKEPIVDEVSAFSDADRAVISDALNKLTIRGADARVQILSSYHNTKSVDEYKQMFQNKCKYWQAPDGGMKNNLILLLVVPKKTATGYYFGSAWNRFLSDNKPAVLSDMNARFRDGKLTEGILIGLKDIDNLISIDPATAKKSVVINNNAAADMSGVSHIMMWFLLILFIAGCGYAFFWYRNRQSQVRAEQREAMTERAKCTTAINSYATPLAIIKSKISNLTVGQEWIDDLTEKCTVVGVAFVKATTAFNALDKSDNNPGTPSLSAEEYKAIANRYRSVSHQFEEAQALLRNLESKYMHATSGRLFPDQKDTTDSGTQHRADGNPSESRGTNVRPASSSSSNNTGNNSPSTHYNRSVEDNRSNKNGDNTIIIMSNDSHHPNHKDDGVFDQRDWESQRSRDNNPVIIEPLVPEDRSSAGDGISTEWGKSGQGDGASAQWGKSGQGDGISGLFSNDSNEEKTSLWTGSGTTY